MPKKPLYKISFYNLNKVYEIYASQVYQSDLYGFVTIEGLAFDERSTVVVDPSEEKLKSEFEQVKRFFVPMHSIIRIDEVDKRGTAKISDADENVAHFPSSVYSPGSNDQGKKS